MRHSKRNHESLFLLLWGCITKTARPFRPDILKTSSKLFKYFPCAPFSQYSQINWKSYRHKRIKIIVQIAYFVKYLILVLAMCKQPWIYARPIYSSDKEALDIHTLYWFNAFISRFTSIFALGETMPAVENNIPFRDIGEFHFRR